MFKNHSRFSYPHFHNQSTVLLKLEIIRSYSRVGLLTVRECVTFCGFCKTLLLSRLRVEHIPHSITLYVRSLIPYISHITIMCWTLNVWKRGRGIMHSLYLHLPYIGCTHVPGTHPPRSLSYCVICYS